jgi:Na+-translocating ferredoxin:NAD+ oxidoreductase RnfG subunit
MRMRLNLSRDSLTALARAALALAVLAGALPAVARGDDPPAAAVEDVYLSAREALRVVLPADEARDIERTDVLLRAGERANLEKRLRTRLFEDRHVVYRGRAASGEVTGYAVITEEIGKFKPITFIVGIRPDGSIREVAVMVYRESHGSDVRRRRFLAQFDDKRPGDGLQPNRDILNVTGATLSVRAVARGVRKALLVVDEVLLGENRRRDAAWTRIDVDGAPDARRRRSSAPSPPSRSSAATTTWTWTASAASG